MKRFFLSLFLALLCSVGAQAQQFREATVDVEIDFSKCASYNPARDCWETPQTMSLSITGYLKYAYGDADLNNWQFISGTAVYIGTPHEEQTPVSYNVTDVPVKQVVRLSCSVPAGGQGLSGLGIIDMNLNVRVDYGNYTRFIRISGAPSDRWASRETIKTTNPAAFWLVGNEDSFKGFNITGVTGEHEAWTYDSKGVSGLGLGVVRNGRSYDANKYEKLQGQYQAKDSANAIDRSILWFPLMNTGNGCSTFDFYGSINGASDKGCLRVVRSKDKVSYETIGEFTDSEGIAGSHSVKIADDGEWYVGVCGFGFAMENISWIGVLNQRMQREDFNDNVMPEGFAEMTQSDENKWTVADGMLMPAPKPISAVPSTMVLPMRHYKVGDLVAFSYVPTGEPTFNVYQCEEFPSSRDLGMTNQVWPDCLTDNPTTHTTIWYSRVTKEGDYCFAIQADSIMIDRLCFSNEALRPIVLQTEETDPKYEMHVPGHISLTYKKNTNCVPISIAFTDTSLVKDVTPNVSMTGENVYLDVDFTPLWGGERRDLTLKVTFAGGSAVTYTMPQLMVDAQRVSGTVRCYPSIAMPGVKIELTDDKGYSYEAVTDEGGKYSLLVGMNAERLTMRLDIPDARNQEELSKTLVLNRSGATADYNLEYYGYPFTYNKKGFALVYLQEKFYVPDSAVVYRANDNIETQSAVDYIGLWYYRKGGETVPKNTGVLLVDATKAGQTSYLNIKPNDSQVRAASAFRCGEDAFPAGYYIYVLGDSYAMMRIDPNTFDRSSLARSCYVALPNTVKAPQKLPLGSFNFGLYGYLREAESKGLAGLKVTFTDNLGNEYETITGYYNNENAGWYGFEIDDNAVSGTLKVHLPEARNQEELTQNVILDRSNVQTIYDIRLRYCASPFTYNDEGYAIVSSNSSMYVPDGAVAYFVNRSIQSATDIDKLPVTVYKRAGELVPRYTAVILKDATKAGQTLYRDLDPDDKGVQDTKSGLYSYVSNNTKFSANKYVYVLGSGNALERVDPATFDIGQLRFVSSFLSLADTINVAERLPITNMVTLDETAEDLPVFDTEMNTDVTTQRTLKHGGWNSLCLPFDVTAAQVRDVLGNQIILKRFKNDTEDAINMTTATSIEAGVPYLVRLGGVKADGTEAVTSDVVNPVFCDVRMQNDLTCKSEGSYYDFIGNITVADVYAATDILVAGKQLVTLQNDGKINGLRAFFRSHAQQKPLQAKRVVLNLGDTDDETTGILGVTDNTASLQQDAAAYNLNGQRVSESVKGIVVVNGKKVIRK